MNALGSQLLNRVDDPVSKWPFGVKAYFLGSLLMNFALVMGLFSILNRLYKKRLKKLISKIRHKILEILSRSKVNLILTLVPELCEFLKEKKKRKNH